ncbi:hypothetical protein NQ318_010084 [Aromia moschata]|uniref:Uncharacterized protein n=1 Tax=Aromia moschata TaxID=1265417 RepID=A0AAV8YB44_9CUCU|nr:hypothetical protein NQ318_010084 [Aromia moschata]
MEEDKRREIVELFKSAQITSATHQKNAQLLKKIMENLPQAEFVSQLKKILTIILTVEKGNKNVERVIDFFSLFCSILKCKQVELNESIEYVDHPLFLEIILFLLECSQLINDIVRF